MASDPLSRAAAFELDLPRERAIDLFTADGERAWVPGWSPTQISGAEQRGSVFETRAADGVATRWIVVEFDRINGRAGYARFAEGRHVGLVDVAIEARGPDRCAATVRYTLTPTSAEGESQVAAMLERQAYDAFIAGWKQAIDDALATQNPAVE